MRIVDGEKIAPALPRSLDGRETRSVLSTRVNSNAVRNVRRPRKSPRRVRSNVHSIRPSSGFRSFLRLRGYRRDTATEFFSRFSPIHEMSVHKCVYARMRDFVDTFSSAQQ